MSVAYNILTGNSQVKGRIGEVIASHYLRKQGFIVDRPSRILRLLGRAGVPNNYEVQFLRRYKKTMDYFAVYPRDDPLLVRREAVCEVFAKGGLDKYSTQSRSMGCVVEVKTNLNGNRPRVSERQARMFRLARKLGFRVILALVIFRESYTIGITLLDEKGVEFSLPLPLNHATKMSYRDKPRKKQIKIQKKLDTPPTHFRSAVFSSPRVPQRLYPEAQFLPGS